MMDADKYLTIDDIERRGGRIAATISGVRREIVDGRPRLVVYFDNEKKGLLLTRQLYADMAREIGPNPKVEEFFRKEGEH